MVLTLKFVFNRTRPEMKSESTIKAQFLGHKRHITTSVRGTSVGPTRANTCSQHVPSHDTGHHQRRSRPPASSRLAAARCSGGEGASAELVSALAHAPHAPLAHTHAPLPHAHPTHAALPPQPVTPTHSAHSNREISDQEGGMIPREIACWQSTTVVRTLGARLP